MIEWNSQSGRGEAELPGKMSLTREGDWACAPVAAKSAIHDRAKPRRASCETRLENRRTVPGFGVMRNPPR